MVRGLKQTSSIVSVGFSIRETIAGTFTELTTDLNLSPLDQEVFVCLAVNLDVAAPDSIAGSDTSVRASVTSTRQTAIQTLANPNCIAAAGKATMAAGMLDSGVGYQTALETPPANLDYIGIIATNDFFVQIQGTNNLVTKNVTGKIYGYRAKSEASIYAALVQSEALSA